MAATAMAAVRKEVPTIASLNPPPASPFAELLRRSKFATYDPAIRQTYSAAPANAHRGDWGLKRPIALRRKNAFISLTSFEHPAHFTEWNHAESQVRFIRRIEETGVKPDTVVGTPWYKSLGKAKNELLLDSEFCPGEGSEMEVKEAQRPQPTAVNFDALGQKGRGAYGAKREEPVKKDDKKMEVYVTANIDAMSPREFERYLRRLRTLRPKFQEYIREQDKDFSQKSLYALAQDADKGYHRKFMMEHMASEYQDLFGRKIEPQPHPNAALTYARNTPLETVLWTKPQPGIILNKYTSERGNAGPPRYVASFGGLGAIILQANLGVNRTPLLDVDSEEGVHRDRVEESFAPMRLLPSKGLQLQMPPQVVGTKPQGLKGVKILAEVTTDTGKNPTNDNPHPLGSPEYVAAPPRPKKSSLSNWSLPKKKPKVRIDFDFSAKSKDGGLVLDTLKGIMSKQNLREGNEEDL
ncbi:hypothetical protein LshimejAT787_0201770 [Lyophyllum shimeji]|uniref:Uncharacterized protein n=1 Tax=Lyophyllum shimeji TaxID=47721 RepID=A0A9P3PES3_LYOSH|nr:hypothetical protein LshimejAT787_0201770 [Lyophyllum shimeji]